MAETIMEDFIMENSMAKVYINKQMDKMFMVFGLKERNHRYVKAFRSIKNLLTMYEK